VQISMTTFLDYVAATGTTRLRRIVDAKQQYSRAYNPASDFYGPLRKRVETVFENGWDPEALDKALREIEDPKKHDHYRACRAGLRKWAGKKGTKKLKWVKPKGATWRSGALEVKISPELWLDIEGKRHIIKLYFKAEALSQHRVNLSLRLLEKTVGRHGAVAVLDVRRGRLFTQTTTPPAEIDLLLASEAAGLAALWESLDGA
jgi:hypothetical protein